MFAAQRVGRSGEELEPKLSFGFAVPAGTSGRDGVGKSPRPPQKPAEGEEDEGIHSDKEEVKAVSLYYLW